MIRTDRETGEPILSTKLTADQLHAMANDPGWRPWMRLIADHPHAWPELVDWWHTAQAQGFDAAGAAPKPPESMRGRRRVAIPPAPLPPENVPEPEPAASTGETRPAEEAPAPEPEPREEPATERDQAAAEEALEAADGDFAALEQVSDPEPATMDIPPIPEPAGAAEQMDDDDPDAYDDPFADIKVRRAIPWKAIGIAAAVALVIGLAAGGTAILAHHRSEETARESLVRAAAACRRAHDTAAGRRDALDRAVEKARKLVSSTDASRVDDRSTLDGLDRLTDKTIPPLPACPAENPDAARIIAVGREYAARAKSLAAAMDKVNRSILDRTVKAARKLHDESAGKVADEKTRTDLARAIDHRDAKAIRAAMDKVNQSIKAKQEADKAKAQADAKAQAERQPQQTTPSPSTNNRSGRGYSYSYTGNTGRTTGGNTGGSTPAPSAPANPTPQPAPSAPSTPSTPSKPSGIDGAVVD